MVGGIERVEKLFVFNTFFIWSTLRPKHFLRFPCIIFITLLRVISFSPGSIEQIFLHFTSNLPSPLHEPLLVGPKFKFSNATCFIFENK